MNERIKQLAKQTGYIWHASGDPQIYEFTPEKLEKFAELIVRDITDAISLLGVDFLEEGQVGPSTLCNSIVEKIIEDYGVENE